MKTEAIAKENKRTMFERFSTSARRVVFWARMEAGRLGSAAIQPEHLLLGFLAEDQGESGQAQVMALHFRKSPLLVEQGALPHEPFFSREKAAALRHMITNTADIGIPLPDTADMPLTEQTERALRAAQERAGASPVNLLHILWALVSDTQNDVNHHLRLNGATTEQVEAALRGR